METIVPTSFKACKHLDFSDSYFAKKAGIVFDGTSKLCWERKDPEGKLQLCQFCKKRGRLNGPTCCLSEAHKQCSEYEEKEFDLPKVG